MKELICIVCPKGCHLRIDEKTLAVTGNACPRGAEYAKKELSNPTRVLTSTVKINGALHCRCPVKTDRDIPKERIFEAVALLDGAQLHAPVRCGDIVIENLLNLGASFVVTKDMDAL